MYTVMARNTICHSQKNCTAMFIIAISLLKGIMKQTMLSVLPINVLLLTDGRKCHVNMHIFCRHGHLVSPVCVLLLTDGRKCHVNTVGTDTSFVLRDGRKCHVNMLIFCRHEHTACPASVLTDVLDGNAM